MAGTVDGYLLRSTNMRMVWHGEDKRKIKELLNCKNYNEYSPPRRWLWMAWPGLVGWSHMRIDNKHGMELKVVPQLCCTENILSPGIDR